jgi:hypothetical protein
MMLMGIVSRQIIGLQLGEVSRPSFDNAGELSIHQEARGSMMNLQMSIICIYLLHSSRT